MGFSQKEDLIVNHYYTSILSLIFFSRYIIPEDCKNEGSTVLKWLVSQIVLLEEKVLQKVTALRRWIAIAKCCKVD